MDSNSMHRYTQSMVINNEYVSNWIIHYCGIRQEFPISVYLFIMDAESLTHK